MKIYPFALFIVVLFSCKQPTKTHSTASTLTQLSPAELHKTPFQSHLDGSKRHYYVYLPKGYRSNDSFQWPVMMFLHGNGERGDGNEQLDFVMTHGPLYEAWIQKRDLPFIMVVPQLPMFGMDQNTASYLSKRQEGSFPKRLDKGTPKRFAPFETNTTMEGNPSNDDFPYEGPGPILGWEKIEKDLLFLLDSVRQHYRTDPSKYYLTGLSYGGFGTWYMASKHPTLFAAISPVVGWGHPDLMDSIAAHQIPVWAFAGGRDGTIKPEYFYSGLNKLESLGHRNVRFTNHEDMNHDAWTRIYGGQDLYNWMLTHKKDSTQ